MISTPYSVLWAASLKVSSSWCMGFSVLLLWDSPSSYSVPKPKQIPFPKPKGLGIWRKGIPRFKRIRRARPKEEKGTERALSRLVSTACRISSQFTTLFSSLGESVGVDCPLQNMKEAISGCKRLNRNEAAMASHTTECLMRNGISNPGVKAQDSESMSIPRLCPNCLFSGIKSKIQQQRQLVNNLLTTNPTTISIALLVKLPPVLVNHVFYYVY